MTLQKGVSEIAGNFAQKNRSLHGKYEKAGTCHIHYRSNTKGNYWCGKSELLGRKLYSEHDSVKIAFLRNGTFNNNLLILVCVMIQVLWLQKIQRKQEIYTAYVTSCSKSRIIII